MKDTKLRVSTAGVTHEVSSLIEEFPEFWMEGLSTGSIFEENFRSLNGTLISLRSLALALTLSGLADFAIAGQRKKAKGSRRTTPNKPLAFSLYSLAYLNPQRFRKRPSGT
ncbi:MAG: hypothetical protein GTO12_06915 [Proteobacteria bacterium]|nr:hypothetical protein [Pseudomonadota bacterium]